MTHNGPALSVEHFDKLSSFLGAQDKSLNCRDTH